MLIRPMRPADLAVASDICTRNGWGDMTSLFAFQLAHDRCHMFVGEVDGEVIATGTGTHRGDVGWVGQISVLPGYRGRGYGTAMTRHVMDVMAGLGCRSLLLFATEMGRPIYERLGFELESEFVVWAGAGLASCAGVRSLVAADLDWVCELDRAAMGEDRGPQLRAFASGGWAVASGGGFLIPTPWGTQAATAATAEAGRALVDLMRAVKHLEPDGVRICLPAANRPGAEYLVSLGFRQMTRIPRMLLGAPVVWNPDMVYGRMSGALD
ncbi:MAG TPA: GNAT family N-acetyltransferase [Symbiobacteriaceae bacterium]|nr:GNAT family N-acetyltransferase [Symbiobacteriaceae bacterium]